MWAERIGYGPVKDEILVLPCNCVTLGECLIPSEPASSSKNQDNNSFLLNLSEDQGWAKHHAQHIRQ